MNKNVLDILCHYLVSSANLAAVIEKSQQFSNAHNHGIHFSQFDEKVTIAGKCGNKNHSVIALYLELYSWLIKMPIEFTTGKKFTSNRSIDFAEFSLHYLQQPVLRSPRDIAALLRTLPRASSKRSLETFSTKDKVYALINKAISAEGVSLSFEQLSNRLHVSESTLRRQLRKDDTSFREIRAHCLKQAAVGYLNNTSLSIGDISTRLDFADEHSFRRAFKSWTGDTAAHVRQLAQQKQSAMR